MRTVFLFVDNLPPPLDDEPDREPGDVVALVPDAEQGRLLIYMKAGTDENTLARELSYVVTTHASKQWVYVGAVVDLDAA